MRFPRPKKTNVILDTEAFESQSFNFESDSFRKLLQFVQNGTIKLYQTSIIHNEIIGHISSRTEAFFKRVKAEIEESRLLKNLESYRILASNEFLPEAKTKLLEIYSSFRQKYIEEIPNPESISMKKILQSYHESIPPFDKAKKKHEFPDAISLAYAFEYFSKKKESVIYVSNDNDIPALVTCLNMKRHVKHLSSINQLIDQLVASDNIKAQLRSLVIDGSQKVLDQLNEKFGDIGLFPIGYDANMLEGEILDIEVNSFFFLEVEEEYALAALSLDVSAKVVLDFDDPDFTYYDSEDKTEYCMERKKAKYQISVPVELQVEFEKVEDHKWEFELILPKQTVAFEFEPDEEELDDA